MKIRRSSNVFEPSRRRGRLPVIRLVVIAALIALLVMAWQRGGEKPQAQVEKPVSSSKLGQ